MRNYRRFYKTLAIVTRQQKVEQEEFKKDIVNIYTNGRTCHLREMTAKEYEAMCEALELSTGNTYQSDRRKARSEVLTLMTKIGIDTTDWNRVDLFCKDKRIAGKAFRHLTLEDLKALRPKLRAMLNKAGKKEHKAMIVPFNNNISN